MEPLSIRSSLEFYHFVVLHVILLMTLIKIVLLYNGTLFLKVITGFPITTLTSLEIFPVSPRYLALFTVSYLSFSHFKGKTQIDRAQYVFQKVVPFGVAVLHWITMLLKRRFILTLDDLFMGIMLASSFALYVTYESPSADRNCRYPWPFLAQVNKAW